MSIAKKPLTDVAIRKAKPPAPGKRKILWDALVPGFAVRITDKGKRPFVLITRFAGAANPTARVLGEHGVMGLDEARQKARDWIQILKTGKDPAAIERYERQFAAEMQREAEAARIRDDASTFASAFELFAKTHLTTLRSGKKVDQTMRRVLLPVWGARQLASLTRKDVSAVIYSIHDGGSPIAANRMKSYITKFDKWAFNRGLIDSPFAVMLEKPAKEVVRDRALSIPEIRALWAACEGVGAFGPCVRMLLATGQRLDEVAAAPWKEIDCDAALWTIPAARTKPKREHKLPLSRLALAILDASPKLGPYIFSATGHGPVRGWSKIKRKLDEGMLTELQKVDPQASLVPWRLHDLRRSAATHLARIGTDRIVVSKILNHIEGGVTARYDRYGRDVEMVEALEAWGVELERIVAGPVVVSLKGRRK
jgi:integrase